MRFAISKYSSTCRRTRESNRGFTLVELLVTIVIFVFMTALVLARYRSFDSGTLLTNLAYDTALNIRLAQSYGLSVKASDQGTNFTSGYGVDFDISSDAPDGKTKFILFADSNIGGGTANMYDWNHSPPFDTVETTYHLKSGTSIKSLCTGTGPNDCNTDMKVLDITFQRPDPTANIWSSSNPNGSQGNNSENGNGKTYAQIVLQSSDGSTRTVVVNKTGQVSVK